MTPQTRLARIHEDAQQFAEPMRSVQIAFGEFYLGLPVQQRCPFCQSPITVELLGESGSAWRTACHCGRCNDTLRGL